MTTIKATPKTAGTVSGVLNDTKDSILTILTQNEEKTKYKKHPIIAISLATPANHNKMLFTASITRRDQPTEDYVLTIRQAEQLLNVVNEYRHKGQATVSPSLFGWVAFIDTTSVYPPPNDDSGEMS